MSCDQQGMAIVLHIPHGHPEEVGVVVESCRDLTLGAVGLLLAEAVAKWCATHPATTADRIAVERSRS